MKPMKGRKKKRTAANETLPRISLLSNSTDYFLQTVFITGEKNAFRLLVIHNDTVLMDKLFPSVRGTRIAFAKYFGNRTWKKHIKAEWSHFYQPEKEWLMQREKIAAKQPKLE
jgi:hypothetical protein